jgi:hypothetical protein
MSHFRYTLSCTDASSHQSEATQLLVKIRRLVVSQCNTMAAELHSPAQSLGPDCLTLTGSLHHVLHMDHATPHQLPTGEGSD